MQVIYISHPFGGSPDNMKRIGEICRHLASQGYIPLSPVHAMSWLDDNVPDERKLGLSLCLKYIPLADAVWVYGEWEGSEGCQKEIKEARRLGVPVEFKKIPGL